MAIIRIKNLRLRAIIGIYKEEREHEQDIILNILFKFDDSKASISDDVNDTVDYKSIKKKILLLVENSSFYLLEKMVHKVLDIIMEDPKIQKAKVKIDKPHALRFADSVSVCKTRTR